ncbi:hypothetical protein [Tenacibaculum aiptasiae]|uniref:hypothetical protein n=1 Tax=Tenacibaculum aiptasiae TaxID=426481 RepID=UPI00232A9DB9|nr:hypothetical protein [Tenacibaculum aiptasiae]
MKKGQISKQNCVIKARKKIQVFYSEKLNAFSLKEESDHLPNENFKYLISCEYSLFNEFTNFLEQFKVFAKPLSFTYKELENKLNQFLISRADNCKTATKVA